MNQRQPELNDDHAASPGAYPGRFLWLWCLLLVALLTGLMHPRPAAAQAPSARVVEDRYNLISAFLYNFLLFTEWPGNDKGALTIGVLGENPFGAAADAIAQKKVAGRPVKMIFFPGPEAITKAHVLFVPREHDHLAQAVCQRLRGQAVLTVGEGEQFTRQGGMIRFFEQPGATAAETVLRVEINETVAGTAGLRFRSRLMRLAQLVQYPWPDTP